MSLVRSAFYGSLVLLSGAVSAVLAHLAIDAIGDVALAHDAYDGLAHGSRAFVAGLVLAGAALVAVRYLWELIERRSGSMPVLLREVRSARGWSRWRFTACVAIVAVVCLAGMEYLDAALAATPIDGAGDLFGGSIALGLGVTLAISLATGLAVRATIAFIAQVEPAISAFLVRLLALAAVAPPAPRAVYAVATTPFNRTRVLARRGGMRAPPSCVPF